MCALSQTISAQVCLKSASGSGLIFSQYHRTNPPCVVFLNPGVVDLGRTNQVIEILIGHATEWQRLYPPALTNMKIGILVPTDDVEEIVSHQPIWLRRQPLRLDRCRQLVTAIE